MPKTNPLTSQGAKHKAELAHKGTLASRQRPSLDGLKTQLSNSSLQDECIVKTVTQVTPDQAVHVTISPQSPTSPVSSQSPSRTVMIDSNQSPSRNVLMQQKRRQSSDTSDPSVGQSFQDQLKSKLEARKRSLEGGDTSATNHVNNVSVQPPTQPSLPLTEVQPVSYKGKNIVQNYIYLCL